MVDLTRRKEQRIPCVEISLLYSALNNSLLSAVASSLANASLHDLSLYGLSFDLAEPLSPGTRLLVRVQQPANEPVETLISTVRWCRELGPGHFRAGVEIASDPLLTSHTSEPGYISLQAGPSVPTSLELTCPTCHTKTVFQLLGLQSVDSPGVMPLYNCPRCTATRSLVSLLSHMRKPVSNSAPASSDSNRP